MTEINHYKGEYDHALYESHGVLREKEEVNTVTVDTNSGSILEKDPIVKILESHLLNMLKEIEELRKYVHPETAKEIKDKIWPCDS